MASQLQLRRGSAAQVAAFTGAAGEVTPDTTNNRLVLHDGVTAGGHPHATEAYVDAEIAAISGAGGDMLAANNLSDVANISTSRTNLRIPLNVFDYIPVAEHAAIQAGTSTYNAATDIQAAIDAWGGIRPIHVPYGKYKIASQLRWSPNTFVGTFAGGLQLVGDGPHNTIFDNQLGATSHTDTFDVSSGSVAVTVHRAAHGLTVNSQITITDASATVGGVSINGTQNVVSVVDANTFTFNNSNIAVSAETGKSVTYNVINPMIDIDTGTSLNFQHFVHLKNFSIKNSTSPTKSTGIRIRRAYQISLEDLWIEGMTRDGVHFTIANQVGGDYDGAVNITMRHVRIENCLNWGIHCDLRPAYAGANELSFLTLDNVFCQGNGTASASLPPPSGGIKWKGQILRITNCGLTINQNCGLFIEGADGLANTVSADGLAVENNIKKGVYITGLQQGEFSNIQFYNNDSYVATSGIEIEGSSFVVANIRVRGAVVRATSGNNPYTAFKLSGANADADTCRVDVRDVAFQNFDYTGQTRWGGWSVDHATFGATKGGTDQTGIASATWTKITYGTEAWDEGGFYDTTNSRWTPPPGVVKLTASVYVNVGVVDQAQSLLGIYKNGAALKYIAIQNASGTSGFVLNGSCIDVADGDDYYEIYINSGGAGSKSVSGNTTYSFFQGEML